MPRKLTDRQVVVLAAVERLGGMPTIPQLTAELPNFKQSEVLRVARSLDKRRYVFLRGNQFWAYLGDAKIVPADEVVRVIRTKKYEAPTIAEVRSAVEDFLNDAAAQRER